MGQTYFGSSKPILAGQNNIHYIIFLYNKILYWKCPVIQGFDQTMHTIHWTLPVDQPLHCISSPFMHPGPKH